MDLRKRAGMFLEKHTGSNTKIGKGAEWVTKNVGAQGIPDYFGGKTGKLGLAKGVVGLAGTIGSLAVGGVALKATGKAVKAAYNIQKYGAPKVRFTGTNPNNLTSQNYVDKLSKAAARRRK